MMRRAVITGTTTEQGAQMTTPKKQAGAKASASEKVVTTTAVVKDSIENLTERVASARKAAGVVKEGTDEAAKRMIEERRDVRLWKETGSKGTRPTTPNIDLLEALNKLAKAGGDVVVPSAATKAKAKASAASSTRILDADVDAKVRGLVKADASLTRSGAVKAFRATGASASQKRITEAFDRVTAGRPVQAKKTAAAKKQAAKPKATKKVTPVKKTSKKPAAAKAAAKKTTGRPFSGPITKESQTRRPAPARKAS
jgi:hypothetical protein